jgi:hypothetical protein
MGRSTAPYAQPKDLMDAIDLLIADHNRAKGLFTRYRNASDSDETAEATALASVIQRELRVHTAIEEKIFYPETHNL